MIYIQGNLTRFTGGSMTILTSPIEHPLGYLRLEQILKIIPVSKATWWNGCRTGRFPKPYKLGPRITAWKISDIKRCLEDFKPSEYYD